jgi:thiamine-monophosphate kinase
MERDLIRWLGDRLPLHERLLAGIGDDAAILNTAPEMDLVATTDMLMDGVDFELSKHDAEQVGRKALAVNLSDLAAMAAAPVAALVSLALPRKGGEDLAKRLYEGMLPLAVEYDCPVAGGDTNSWDGPLVISVTALGHVPHARRWLRSGAKPGDAILVTGQFGGSIRGNQFSFAPRVREALALAEKATIHAAIDVSDGLTLDLFRICEASGCGAVLELAAIPIASAAEDLAQCSADSSTALDHALADGEDFELVLAVPEAQAARLIAEQPLEARLTRIGVFVTEHGLFAVGKDGRRESIAPRGYEHRLDS